MSSWQFRSMQLAFVRVHLFFIGCRRSKSLCKFIEQNTYSAANELMLVHKQRILDLNVYLVKQFYSSKQNITFVSMTDVYDTRA